MQLSEREAYNAMVYFLEVYYRQTHSDDVGALLSSMLLFHDGTTADPAIWGEWLRAIEEGKDKANYFELR